VEYVYNLETGLATVTHVIRFVLEAIGAFWIAVGASYALIDLVKAHINRQTGSFTSIRLTFSRYLSLALEFQLASDILSTAVAPSWEEIGKLGATAVIRTALNYFLTREMREYRERQAGEGEVHGDSVEPMAARS